jgi:hypothetical protein
MVRLAGEGGMNEKSFYGCESEKALDHDHDGKLSGLNIRAMSSSIGLRA